MVQEHSQCDLFTVWQMSEPGFLAEPPRDVVVQRRFTYLHQPEHDGGDVGFTYAPRKHSIARSHRNLPLAIRESNRQRPGTTVGQHETKSRAREQVVFLQLKQLVRELMIELTKSLAGWRRDLLV